MPNYSHDYLRYINRPLSPIMRKELHEFYLRHGYVPDDLIKKLEDEQLRCQTMTKSSIEKDRNKRGNIELGVTLVASIVLCLITGSPFGLALLIMPLVKFFINKGTIKESRDSRLEGAGKSVIALYEKQLHEKALEPLKQPEKQAEKLADKESIKATVKEVLAENPKFWQDWLKTEQKEKSNGAHKVDKKEEDALRTPAFYGISNRGNSDLAIY